MGFYAEEVPEIEEERGCALLFSALKMEWSKDGDQPQQFHELSRLQLECLLFLQTDGEFM